MPIGGYGFDPEPSIDHEAYSPCSLGKDGVLKAFYKGFAKK
jgi:hypothetical protein